MFFTGESCWSPELPSKQQYQLHYCVSSQLSPSYFHKPERKAGNKMVSLNPVNSKCWWGGKKFPSLLTWMVSPCSGHWQDVGANYTIGSNEFYQLLILWDILSSIWSFIQFILWSRFWGDAPSVYLCCMLAALVVESSLYVIKTQVILW